MELMTPFEFLVLGTLWFGIGFYQDQNGTSHWLSDLVSIACLGMALIAWAF